jgi:hypothetical protein
VSLSLGGGFCSTINHEDAKKRSNRNDNSRFPGGLTESTCGWEATMTLLAVGFRGLDAHQSKIDGKLTAVVDLVLRDSLNDG